MIFLKYFFSNFRKRFLNGMAKTNVIISLSVNLKQKITTLLNYQNSWDLQNWAFHQLYRVYRISVNIPFLIFLTRENPWWLKKYKRYNDLFGSVPYSGRSSSIKSLCSKTELNRCTTTEIPWNKTEDARTSLVVFTIRLPNSHPCWLGRGTTLQSGRIHHVMRVQHTWPPCYMPQIRLLLLLLFFNPR